eukprot:m.100772 g.100772  ORF g.100772 m.100772 type:complete len:507 (+) comp13723_c0_seq2:168-1688(+)
MSVFDLESRQRRIRHVTGLCARNLSPLEPERPLHTFVTLHMDPSQPCFYRTETYLDSVNPTWQQVDSIQFTNGVDLGSSRFIVRVWATDKDYAKEEDFNIFIEWDVDLYALEFLDTKLENANIPYPPNSLIFGMLGGYYRAPIEGSDSGDGKRKREETTTVDKKKGGNIPFIRVDRQKVKNSYSGSSIERIAVLQKSIHTIESKVTSNKAEAHELLQERNEREKTERECARLKMKLRLAGSELREKTAELKMEHVQLRETRISNDKRAASMKASRRVLDTNKEELGTMNAKLNDRVDLLQQAQKMVSIRQTRIILQLHSIYNLEMISAKDSLCQICGLTLPNSDFTGYDEETVATALGYTAHLVAMIAKYLDLPLRYPILPMCSRSSIRDDVNLSIPEKDRLYPLYMKGKEKGPFEHGVSLLNQDIKQLLDSQLLESQNINATLPNLMLLLSHFTKLSQQHIREVNLSVRSKNSGSMSSSASQGRSINEEPKATLPKVRKDGGIDL